MPLQVRRGTEIERTNMTQPLASGELLYVTNDQKLYVGDGNTLGGIQITGYTDGDAKDSAAEIFTGGTHNGITFSYNTATNVMTANVNLSNYAGTIKADAFKGTFVGDDSTILVDGVSGTLRGNLVGNVTGSVTGNVTGNLSGNVTGNVTGNTTGIHNGSVIGSLVGDVKGSIVGDDSTILVDGVDNLIRGDVDNLNVSTGAIVIDKDLAAGGILILSEASLEDDVNIFNIITAHNDTSSSGLTFSRSRGTIASPADLNTNDQIFALVFAGQSTADIQPSARIDAKLDGSVGTDIVPGILSLSTADSTGTMIERLSINSKGTSTFTGMMQMATFADETAANAAVGGSPVNGMMYYDSGAGKIKGRQGGAWVILQA
jgi:hypothetical protein